MAEQRESPLTNFIELYATVLEHLGLLQLPAISQAHVEDGSNKKEENAELESFLEDIRGRRLQTR